MRSLNCTCLAAVVLAAPVMAGQAPALQPGAPGAPTAFTVFFRGVPLGREEVTVRSDPSGVTIAGRSRLGAPFNLTLDRVEFRYAPDGTALSFLSEGSVNGGALTLQTTFANGTATTEGTQNGQPVAVSLPVTPDAIMLPNGIFAGYVALAQRLAGASERAAFRLYVLPQAEIGVRVEDIHQERMQVGPTIFSVRRYDLVFENPDGDLPVSLTATTDGGLVRVNVAAAGIDVVRTDIAAATSRTQVFTNAGEEAVTIPVTGFNLAGTLTKPVRAAGRLPAVVILPASGIGDRDGFGLGPPIYGQLAGALAEAGFLVVRYDKRGFGQSGGRSESATLSDYADDARAVVRWLADRRDVNRDRIALVGHGEGAWIALLAAGRERRRVAAVASLAGAAATGESLLLEQQRRALDELDLPDAEREERIALQKQIHEAVRTGRGWEQIPAGMRRDADTPWFQSLLQFDPARALGEVRQPLLIVHGDLDRQIPVSHADILAGLARTQGRSPDIEVVIVKGVNHLLVPAMTGEVSEYAELQDATISVDVARALAGWLTKTVATPR